MRLDPHRKPPWMRAYSFALATGILFLLAWLGQFVFQLQVVQNDADAAGHDFTWAVFWAQFWASTLQNWQSEFLQLIWQTAGLAVFYFWGSSQSREGQDRLEAKVDELLRRLPDRHVRNYRSREK